MPAPAGSDVARTQSALANAIRSGQPASEIADHRRAFAAAKIAAAIDRILTDAPTLTAGQVAILKDHIDAYGNG